MYRFIGLVIVLFAIGAHAEDLALDVKPGLWEITSKGKVEGAPPIPPDVLAKLTPEQRAKMEAAMSGAAANGAAPRARKSCVTQQDLQKSFTSLEQSPKENCRSTVIKNTARVVELHQECTGERQMTGDFHFEAASREAMTGTVKVMMSDGTRTMTSNHEVTGKWLSNDCGSLKRD